MAVDGSTLIADTLECLSKAFPVGHWGANFNMDGTVTLALCPPEPMARLTDPCAAFRRASRAVTQLYDLVLAPTGIKATQFITLQAIAEHGEIAQFRIAREYGMSVETLSRRLSTLRRLGWVSVCVGNGRKRERHYRLTPKGVDKLEAAAPYWTRAQDRLRKAMAESDWKSALAVAEQITEAAREAECRKTANVAPAHSCSLAADAPH